MIAFEPVPSRRLGRSLGTNNIPPKACTMAGHDGAISEHFGEAPYFALIRVRLADGAIEEQQVIANPHKDVEKARGIRVAEWLIAQKADVVLLRESLHGKGPVYVFGDAGVEMQEAEATTLSAVMVEVADWWSAREGKSWL